MFTVIALDTTEALLSGSSCHKPCHATATQALRLPLQIPLRRRSYLDSGVQVTDGRADTAASIGRSLVRLDRTYVIL